MLAVEETAFEKTPRFPPETPRNKPPAWRLRVGVVAPNPYEAAGE